MLPAIYDEMVSWYPLLDPVEDHEDEVDQYIATFERAIRGSAQTVLELGAGAGNNGHYLARRFACTLTDVSTGMLDLSRAQNPGCVHHRGDMRAMRLGQTFDAVLAHDALAHLTTRADVQATMATAFAHLRPGGAAIVAPDLMRETFQEHSGTHARTVGDRTLRVMEWCWDPDPDDELCRVDYAYLLREGAELTAAHDTHPEGLFPQAFWVDAMRGAGFVVERVPRLTEPGYADVLLVGRRP